MHHERRNMNENKSNDLQTIITQVIEEMKSEQGDKFDLNKINLAEMERRTGLTRAQLRRIKANGFLVVPHALTGRKATSTIISGYTGVIDDLLKKNVSNSEVILERIQEQGYTGSLTTVKRYISEHKDLIPPKRQAVAPQGNRGRRYTSNAGESYQMDWGFVNVDTDDSTSYKVACFAMICHHCGERYIEFFPNTKQENLFIGMIHAFKRMGVPDHVLTDNMKSVVLYRDSEGRPVWNHDYETFMNTIGFETKLCRPRHPFTKGSVERLVRFVKENFLAGRVFGTITDLNYEAWKWCDNQNHRYHKAVDCIPHERHSVNCMKNASLLKDTFDVKKYLCPIRCISFDGFVTYEGRRFGIPYSYGKHTCRVQRENFTLYIYDLELRKVLVTHDVTWSRKDSFCRDQFVDEQPEERPSVPVKISISQKMETPKKSAFAKFAFGGDRNE